ncbi:MAG: NAD-dependent deacylase [Bacteroidia bacterium]|nr:NAD-dependent deacylase [Bacteroidia bacterium]
MKRLVILSGAGMSAESGIRTFRDMNGLWEEYDVMEVASIEAWYKNPELLLRFYNDRRKQMIGSKPNHGHLLLAELEKSFDVQIITQNVDDLHERAGSTKVLHLHGELTKARSSIDPALIYTLTDPEMNMGDKCGKGSQLRPHIVWFGEEVPAMAEAVPIVESADYLCVIGTSLNVYPAAGLINYAPSSIPLFLIDPNPPGALPKRVQVIAKGASEGVADLMNRLNELRK